MHTLTSFKVDFKGIVFVTNSLLVHRWTGSGPVTNWIPGVSSDIPELGAPDRTVQPCRGRQPQPLPHRSGIKLSTK